MNSKMKYLVKLHLLLLLYSFTGVLSKIAAKQEFLSTSFIIFYVIMITILFAYALLWQRILKVVPLTVAFANKAIVVLWGLLWGALLFNEVITVGDIIGVGLVCAGIYMVVKYDE